MQTRNPSKAIRAAVRFAVAGAGALLLGGCATGYRFVQPDTAGGGSYYTGTAAQTGRGYYDDYATGPYYPDSSGWGYYNGVWSYPGAFGWPGGYGSWFTIGSTWGLSGYWGPWYTSGYRWRCNGPGCASWRHRHDGHHDAPKPWLKPDHAPLPPQVVGGVGAAHPAAVPDQVPFRRSLDGSPAFLPNQYVRAPGRRPLEAGFNRVPLRATFAPPIPVESAFANRRMAPDAMAAPRVTRPVAQPVFRSRPAPIAPVVSPVTNTSRAIKTEVQ